MFNQCLINVHVLHCIHGSHQGRAAALESLIEILARWKVAKAKADEARTVPQLSYIIGLRFLLAHSA